MQTSKNMKKVTSAMQDVQDVTLEKVHDLVKRGLWEQVDESLVKKHITKILQNSDKKLALHYLQNADIGIYTYLPQVLRSDEDIIRLVLERKPSMYHAMSQELRQKSSTQETALSAALEQQVWVHELISLLEEFRKEKKSFAKHLKKLKKTFEKDSKYFRNSFESSLFDLYIYEYETYQVLMQSKVLSSGKNALWDPLMKYLSWIGDGLEGLSPEEVQEKLLEEIYTFSKISGKMSSRLKVFLLTLVQSISLKQLFPKQKKAEEEESQEEDTLEQDEKSKKAPDNPILEGYNYSHIGSSYSLWDEKGSSVELEEKVVQTMSSKSLENYITFSQTLRDLWLIFLLRKHAQKLSIAMGINFYEGNGMSEARMLKFFNSLGKNIWVPEESYEDAEGNKKVWCFQSLGAAKLRFGEIRDTGKVWDLNTSGMNLWGKSTVEVYMKLKGLIVEPFWEISIARWK